MELLADYAIIWLVVGLFILLAVTTPNFLSQVNLRNMLDQQSLILIAATGIAIFAVLSFISHLLLRKWHESAIKREG